MALITNLRKSVLNILRSNHTFRARNINTTPSLSWFNQRLFRASSFKEKENRFLEKDKVPKNYQLIYKSPMESYVAWATHVSTATVSVVAVSAIYQFATKTPILDPVGTTLEMQSEDIYFFAAGFLLINALLRLVIFMFPLRIYKDNGKYIAVYHSQVPLGISHYPFEKGQVKAVHNRFSPWSNCTYKLGGKTSVLLEDYFKTPSEFHEMRDIKVKKFN